MQMAGPRRLRHGPGKSKKLESGRMDNWRSPIPSVDEVLRLPEAEAASAEFGRSAILDAVRQRIASARTAVRSGAAEPAQDRQSLALQIARAAVQDVAQAAPAHIRPVLNLTGTVLHTNLGRAVLAAEAVAAAATVMAAPATVEYVLSSGQRGERDDAVRDLICSLTGAEDATVVNNNAAAVLLVLSALAAGRETIVSRGELIEIGGAFRMPDVMASAGTRLREVGTTNRTHLRDYATAIGPETALLMKVHPSNFAVVGFTKAVPATELSALARDKGIPLVDDLGSGTLVDLTRYGLARERTVQDAIRDGADIVTFSGDKLLGGPQAGFIAGRRDLVRLCARHPLKRALRLDKIRLAALEATLKLYRNPDSVARRLPTLAALSRPVEEIRDCAERLVPAIAQVLGEAIDVGAVATSSQVGSGALPLEAIPSYGISLTPSRSAEMRQITAEAIAAKLRTLPLPVIGRIERGAVILDVRCLAVPEALLQSLRSFTVE